MDLIEQKLGIIENLYGTLGSEIDELKILCQKKFDETPQKTKGKGRKNKLSPGFEADILRNRLKVYD